MTLTPRAEKTLREVMTSDIQNINKFVKLFIVGFCRLSVVAIDCRFSLFDVCCRLSGFVDC